MVLAFVLLNRSVRIALAYIFGSLTVSAALFLELRLLLVRLLIQWKRLLPSLTAPIPALLVLPPGLGRIFDVSKSGSISPYGTTPTSKEDLSFSGSDESLSAFSNIKCLKFASIPVNVDMLKVDDLQSLSVLKSVFAAERRRPKSTWLAVYVNGTTTVVLFPPVQGLKSSRIVDCMEWLEDAGITQILAAVPCDNEAVTKSLQFLGFSRVSSEAKEYYLPFWDDKFCLLVTDFTAL